MVDVTVNVVRKIVDVCHWNIRNSLRGEIIARFARNQEDPYHQINGETIQFQGNKGLVIRPKK